MKAEKVIVTIVMESLSIDTLNGMLFSVIEQIEKEAESGELKMQDGDCIKWKTTRKAVEF